MLKVNSNERAFVGESSSYSYEEREFYYVLGDDVRKRYEKDFSSIDRREKIFRERRKERETKTFHQREREREDLARAAIKNFFAAIDFLVVPKLFVLFSFFSSSPAFFFNRLFLQAKRMKSLV